MFLKNRNIIFKMKIPKVTDYAALSAKKVLYAIFFSGEGVAIKVLVEKGKIITIKYYKDARPVTGFMSMSTLIPR